jgi:hypothetical protein
MTVPRSHRPCCALPDATPYGLTDTIEDMIRVWGRGVCGRKLGSAVSGTCQIRHALPCPPLLPRKPKQVRGPGIQPCVRMSWRLSHPAPPCRKHQTKTFAQGPDWRDRAVHLMSSRARAENTHEISRINSADGITVPIFFSSGHSYTHAYTPVSDKLMMRSSLF